MVYIDKLSNGDRQFKARFLNVIKEEFPIEMEIYMQNVRDKKYRETAFMVHKLKHKLNIFGLEKSYALAVQYEELLLKNNNSLEKEFKEILQEITEYLKNLSV